MKNRIGIIGLGVMGASLAQNFASRLIPTAAYNHHFDKTKTLIKMADSPYLMGYEGLGSFVNSISRPRIMILMVPAGEAVDSTLDRLIPHLSKGDIVIDGGNSHYSDTLRRTAELNKKSIHYMGAGISGGEEGARKGPSIMIGTGLNTWKKVKRMLQAISAKDFQGKPCAGRVGDAGSGHYVKMVHNSIEYGLMQLIAESYALLKNAYALENKKIVQIFQEMAGKIPNSFLLETAIKVIGQKDESGKKDLINLILDTAGSKGTGMWSSAEALALGVATPIATSAVYARYLSSEKQLRKKLSRLRTGKTSEPLPPLHTFTIHLEKALYIAFLITYSEGFMLLKKANESHKFHLNLNEIARIWQGGCIIRSGMLMEIREALNRSSSTSLFKDKKIIREISENLPYIKKIITLGMESEVATPAFSACLNLMMTLTTEMLPASLIQGMRDLFGAHAYERIDKKGVFHTNWEE